MIGGFNKLLRNFASLKGKSEFEKVNLFAIPSDHSTLICRD